ncbi:MAG: hypothetical protein R3F54_11855 [Alphaproteobacteria bacterium]
MVVPAGPAGAAEQPCDRLFVPDGYELTCTVERKGGDDAWEVSVHPTDGTFASLSELTLSPVDGVVADPAAWLKKQVQIDVSGLESALTNFLDDQDNPFAGESWWTSLQGLKDVVHSLSDLPLDSCAEPRADHEDGWVIDCDWGIGSLRQLLTVRLVERDGVYYGLRVQSMNERRHRHLQAIANSF